MNHVRTATAVLTAAMLTVLFAGLSHAQGSFTETFDTGLFKDADSTTADWNTAAGELRLYPFVVDSIGGYDTPGNAHDVEVRGTYCFVADDVQGMHIFDISDPANPLLLGTYASSQAFGLDIHGDYAYIADSFAGLRIVDISDPTTPTLLGVLNLNRFAYDVVVEGDHAYVANEQEGVIIIDVSNPAAPVQVGVYDTSNNARGLDVDGNYCYVADRSAGGLVVLDVSDPTNPTLAANILTGADLWNCDVQGDVLYLGNTAGGLAIYDITDPTNPTLLGSIDPGSCRDVDVSGDFAFLAGYDLVHMVDVSDPTNPTLLGSFDNFGFASAIIADGEFAYVADGSAGGLLVTRIAQAVPPTLAGDASLNISGGLAIRGDLVFMAGVQAGLRIGDISDPTNPVLVGSITTPGFARDVDVSGNFAYVADDDSGLVVFDVSDPTNPTQVGSVLTGAEAYGVTVTGDYAYVGAMLDGLFVVDIGDPANPTIVGSYGTSGPATKSTIAGDLAFVCANQGGLQILNVGDPTNPTFVATYVAGSFANNVAVAGDRLYLVDRAELEIVDISNPASPALLGKWPTPGFCFGVAVAGDFAFVRDRLGIYMLDVSTPTNPTVFGTLSEPDNQSNDIIVAGDYVYTSALVSAQVFQREFDLDGNRGQSGPGPSAFSLAASVTATQTGNVDWELSADGGATWESFPSDGAWQVFGAPGNDLRWRTTHNWSGGGVNPSVDDVTVAWRVAEPGIDTIEDIPNDQGKQVRLTWLRSGYDIAGSSTPITSYAIFREIDPNLSAPPSEVEAPKDGTDPAAFIAPVGWDLIATWPAFGEDGYSVVVPTLKDSTISEGAYNTTFLVRAATATPTTYWDSWQASGYSLDNLSPMVPQGMSAAYNTGVGNQLTWDPPVDEDFQYFRIYRGFTPDFPTDGTTLVAGTTAPAWTDPDHDGGGVFYKTTAVDHSGNESDAAEVGTATAVRKNGVARHALHPAVPNPFNPTTTITYEVPAGSGPVTLMVFDVSGKKVRTLVSNRVEVGQRSVQWDGRTDAGAQAASGVYFYRMVAGEFSATRKMVMLK